MGGRLPRAGRLSMSIAIAVPNLNQARFLGAALDSLTAASPPVHVAVLDAGSNDGSRELIEGRASELSYWRSTPDAGQAAAVNEGVALLTSRHADVVAVGWLNADDIFLSGGLERLWQSLLAHPEWVAVAGRGALLSEEGSVIGEVPTQPFRRERFADSCTICQPATLIRRSAWERVGGLDASLDMCFDYDLWWKLARLGEIGYLDTAVAASRDHQDTKTRQRRPRFYREARAIVRREMGRVAWHWYLTEAMERQVGYQIGVRPAFLWRLRAHAEACITFALEGRRLGS